MGKCSLEGGELMLKNGLQEPLYPLRSIYVNTWFSLRATWNESVVIAQYGTAEQQNLRR